MANNKFYIIGILCGAPIYLGLALTGSKMYKKAFKEEHVSLMKMLNAFHNSEELLKELSSLEESEERGDLK